MIQKASKRLLSGLLLGALLFAGTACDDGEGDHASNDVKTNHSKKDLPVVDSLEVLSQSIIENPNALLPYLNRARFQMKQGDYQSSYEDIQRAKNIDSTNAQVRFTEGDYFFEIGQIGKAKYSYESAVESDDAHTSAMLGLAEVYLVLSNIDRSIEWVNKALRINEQLPRAYLIKGLNYRASGSPELAKSSFQTASELDPSDPEVFNLLGMTYGDERDDLALVYYDTTLELDSMHLEALYNRAYYLQSAGRFDEALLAYQTLLRRHSETAAAYYNMAYIKMGFKDDMAGSISDLTEAIRINPAYVQAYQARGVALEELGKFEDAKSDFDRALELEPNYAPSIEALNRLQNY